MRVLCLDIEGGHGGSSRSLFELVRGLDRDQIAPEVWCRRGGAIHTRYAALGVPTRTVPDLPRFTSVPRLSRNLYLWLRARRDFIRSGLFREALVAEVTERFDLVHFNHEALFQLAAWLRPRVPAAFTMHIRTNLVDSWFARRQTTVISQTMDRLIFISKNEHDRFKALGGIAPACVVYNIAQAPEAPVARHAGIPENGAFTLASLSNFDPLRGTDRLFEIAGALRRMGRADIRFIVAGTMRLPARAYRLLGPNVRGFDDFAAYVKTSELADMFTFLGHVPDPMSVLAGVDALVKPTREANPWSREILESLAAGKPVVTVGRYDVFVEDGVTGVLLEKYDVKAMAKAIVELADNPARTAKLGSVGQGRIAKLCNARDRAAEVAEAWRAAAAGRRG